MDIDIYKVELKPNRYVWFFDKYGEPLVTGPDPIGDMADASINSLNLSPAVDAAKGGTFTAKELYPLVRRNFRGASLFHRSAFWARIDEYGTVEIKKNRRNETAPPFTTEEEFAIVSAANGWPDPDWLDEVVKKVAAEIVARRTRDGGAVQYGHEYAR